MKKIITPLLLVFAVFSLQAQNYSYTFGISVNPYQNLTNAVSLNNGLFWDDPNYTIPIGFDFEICGDTYQNIYISDWGYGGSLFFENPPVGPVSVLMPISQDIIDFSHSSGESLSPISYKTVGTVGNRILKIEWKKAGFLVTTDHMSFQVWLYEKDNAIAYHYGESVITNPSGSFDGKTGPTVGFFSSINWDTSALIEPAYFLTGNPSAPILVDSSNPPPAGTPNQLTGMIPEGTIYTFTPKDLSVVNSQKINFLVYPNPVRNAIHLHLKNNVQRYKVEVFSITGQQVKVISQLENESIDLSDLSAGTYFVKLIGENGAVGMQSIIKE